MEPKQNTPQNPSPPEPEQPVPTPANNPVNPVPTESAPAPIIEPSVVPDATPVFPPQTTPEQPDVATAPVMPPTEIAAQQPVAAAEADPGASGSSKTDRLKKLALIAVPIIIVIALLLIYLFPVAGGAASAYGNKLKEQDLSVEDSLNTKLASTTSISTASQVDKAKSDIATIKNDYAKTISERPKLTRLPLASLNSKYKLALQTEKDVAQYDQTNTALIEESSKALNYVGTVYAKVDEFQKQVRSLPIPTSGNLDLLSTKIDALAKLTKESAASIEKTEAPAGLSENKKIIVTAFNDLSSVYNKFTQAIQAKNVAQINEAAATERTIITKLNTALKDSSLSNEFKEQVNASRDLGDKIQANLNQL